MALGQSLGGGPDRRLLFITPPLARKMELHYAYRSCATEQRDNKAKNRPTLQMALDQSSGRPSRQAPFYHITPGTKCQNPTKSEGLGHDSHAIYQEIFVLSQPYNNRCKAPQGSHNNHSNSTTSEEEFSFKAPPEMSFATLTAHVLPSNVITSR